MKPDWDFLLDENTLATVLPDEYTHFARPIRDGLTIFLSGLREADQIAILRAQGSLPASAPITQRLGILARSSPVLQKLGQLLARDQRLSPEFRYHLQQLESLPPTIPLETIQDILTRELGPLERRGITLTPPAIAEASVAVVIPFRQGVQRQSDYAEGTENVEGVFKVLKPDIEAQLEHELALMESVGAHLDQRCDELGIPHLGYEESFQQVRDKLSDEIRLENEQRHLSLAGEFYADEPYVQIPRVLEHCTSRVTAMSRISGGKVTDHGHHGRSQQRRLASQIARALIAKPIFSRSDQALFHCDPHAGNLFLTDDGKVAILDWSLVGTLGERERTAIVQIMLGAITLDAQRIIALLDGLSERQPADRAALALVVQDWTRRIRRGQFPGLSWLIGMLDAAVQHAGLRVSGDMMLFRKTLHTLEGVVAEVGAAGQIDKVLIEEFLYHFAVEWPQRWLRLPHSRDFATRLSNLDLTHTMLSYPETLTRFWSGHAADLLAAIDRSRESANPAISVTSAVGFNPDLNVQTETSCPSNI